MAIDGAALGLVGSVCLFVQQMAGHLGDHAAWFGLAIAFLGTLCFSAGNLLSSRMQSMGLHPFATNRWAMLIGASVLTIGSALAGFSFAIEPDARYLGALAYLAVFGSVIGFTAYLMLVGRIGPERAAYCTVLFPIVALAASTVFEGYRWTALAVVGLVLVVAGNLVAFDLTRRIFARRVQPSWSSRRAAQSRGQTQRPVFNSASRFNARHDECRAQSAARPRAMAGPAVSTLFVDR